MTVLAVEPQVELQPVEVLIRPMLTPSRALDAFLDDLERQKYAPKTLKTYGDTIGELVDTLDHSLDVSQITLEEHLRPHFATYRLLKKGTVATKEAAFSSFFKWLFKNGYVKANPMDRLNRTRRPNAEDLDVTTVSTDDARRLLFMAEGWPERLAISVLLYLGPRRHAASELRIGDFDRARGRMRFREKGGKVIWKPVPRPLDALIEEAVAAGVYAAQDYLIPSDRSQRKPGTRDDRVIWRIVKDVGERAGVEVHTHALRAAFACFYLEQNPGNIEGLRLLLGHRSIATTQVYLRKLDKQVAMEPVRELSWGTAVSWPVADDALERRT